MFSRIPYPAKSHLSRIHICFTHTVLMMLRYRCVGACGICVRFRLWSCSLLHMYHFKNVIIRMINDPYLPLGLHVKAVVFCPSPKDEKYESTINDWMSHKSIALNLLILLSIQNGRCPMVHLATKWCKLIFCYSPELQRIAKLNL